jgi:hypothetical protein
MAPRHGAFPFGLRPPSNIYARQAIKSSQIQSGWRRLAGDLKPELRAHRDLLDIPCTYHKAHDIPSAPATCGRRSTKSGSLVPHELPRLQMAASFRRFRSTSPPTTRVPSFARSWWFVRRNHHVTVRWISRRCSGFRETPTTLSDVRKNSTVQFPLRLRPSSRVRGDRAIDVQQPSCQPGRRHGTSPASRPHAQC